MRVFISGVAGFIGFHVAKKLLTEGNKVYGIDNMSNYYDVRIKEERVNQLEKAEDKFHFKECDLTFKYGVMQAIKDFKPDVIIHLGAQAGVPYSKINPWEYIRTNIEGTITILEAAVQYKIKRLLYASSSSVYGSCSIPWKEVQNPRPMSVYGVSKYTDELLAKVYLESYGLETTGMRFFSVYGPWGRPDMVIWKFVKAIDEGTPLSITIGSERDFTYIDDVVKAITELMFSAAKTPVINIGFGKMINVTDLAEMISGLMGIRVPLNMVAAESWDAPSTCSDASLIEETIGKIEVTPLEEGLKNFIQWYLEWKRGGKYAGSF